MPSKRTPPSDDSVHEFFGREYTALISLYTHHENGLASLFNFYITLLTTLAGAIIVLIQLNTNPSSILSSIIILLFFAIMLGVVVQEAVLNKAVDITQISRAINLLKQEALKDHPESWRVVEYLYNPFSRTVPVKAKQNLYDRLGNRFWYLKWVGPHQLFISIFNSLEIGLLVVVLVVAIAPGAVALWKTILASVAVSLVSLYVHAVYANLEFRHRNEIRQLRMSDIHEPPND